MKTNLKLRVRLGFGFAVFTSFFFTYLSPVAVAAEPRLKPAEFELLVRSEKLDPVSDEALARLQNYEYVLIPGFHNETRLGFFSSTRRILKEFKVPAANVHMLWLPSPTSIDINAEALCAYLEKLSDGGKKKLILYSHSKGGAETLSCAIRHAEFFSKSVEASFLIQPAIGGSYIADYFMESANIDHSKEREPARTLMRVAGRAAPYIYRPLVELGLKSLTTAIAAEYWTKLLTDNPNARDLIADKIYYVRSFIKPAKNRFRSLPSSEFLTAHYEEPHDGLLLLSQQCHRELGTVLTTLESNHNDLVNRGWSKKADIKGLAFNRALLTAIAQLE